MHLRVSAAVSNNGCSVTGKYFVQFFKVNRNILLHSPCEMLFSNISTVASIGPESPIGSGSEVSQWITVNCISG